MNTLKYLSLGAGLLLAGASLSRAQSRAGGAELDERAIDEYLTARMRSARVPGLAAVVVKGERIVYLKGFGQAVPSGRPVTPQTPFIIGSITKPFTALAVMQLVEAGRVQLDAPVQRYLPWFRTAGPAASARITVRMLIDQTSGLPQKPTLVTWTWPDAPDALERLVRLMANSALNFPPGESFAYSNANYVTLAVILQAVTGQSYEDYVREQIFAPLEMQHSYVSQEEAVRDGMAVGHRWWFGFPVPATLPYNRANLPAGFIISSAEDMAHFLIAQLNEGRYRGRQVLSPEMTALMQAEPPPGTYGLGWESVRLAGRRLINADGATANFQGSLFFDAEAGTGVFVAANVMSALDGLSSSLSSSSLGARSLKEIARRLLDPEDRKSFLVSAQITTRGLAHSVLNLATGQPLPPQGPGQRRVSLVYTLALLALSGALGWSLARLPGRCNRLAQRGFAGRSSLARRSVRAAIFHFSGPLALLYAKFRVPFWPLAVLYQPDLISWLFAASAILSLKGILEIALAWRVFREGGRRRAARR